MKKSLTILLILFSLKLFSQNVGVGTTTPLSKLHIVSTDTGMLRLENTTVLATGISNALYFKTGSWFTGAIKNTGTGTNVSRTGFYGFASAATNNLKEYLSILDNGNIGIGTISPSARLEINSTGLAYGLLQNDGNTAIGLNTSSSGGELLTKTKDNLLFGTFGGGAAMTLDTFSTFTVGQYYAANNAGLVVNKNVGATYGLFGGTTTGVSVQANFPGIGFNEYYNGGSKFIGTGYAGKLTMSPTSGDISFYASTASGVANGSATVNPNLTLSKDGAVTIQGTSNGYIFKDRTDNTYAGWNWYANAGKASLYRYTSGGDLLTIDAAGKVGIGTTIPSEKLTVQTATNSLGISHTDGTYKIGTYVGGAGAGGYFGTISNHPLYFMTNNGAAQVALLTDGRFCIGTTAPATGYLLNVNGKIISEEVRVQLNSIWPDYVFDKNYKRLSLNELEKFVDENKHLPNIPNAAEIEKDGQMLGDVQRKMLEKIEELSLYLIEQNKRITKLEMENAALKKSSK